MNKTSENSMQKQQFDTKALRRLLSYTSRFLLQGNQDSLRPFPVLFFAAVGPQDSIQQRSKDASNACKEPRTRGDGAGIGGAACIAAVQPCSGSAYQR